jgi:hypothetical protein
MVENKEMWSEEKDSLLTGMQEMALIMQEYNDFASTLEGKEVKTQETTPSVNALMGMTTLVATLEPSTEPTKLSKAEVEQLQVAHEILDGWNKIIVKELPALNAEKESYDEFTKKYHKEGIKGDEWANILKEFDQHAEKVAKDKNISYPNYFYASLTK